jgi:hypothetical protein
MADDPFPGPEEGTIVAAIGDREYQVIFPEDGSPPYARYSVQLLDANGDEVIMVEQGFLFRIGGADHLTNQEKQQLQAMDVRLKAKGEAAWLGKPAGSLAHGD